jgi:acetyl esterase/lipase
LHQQPFENNNNIETAAALQCTHYSKKLESSSAVFRNMEPPGRLGRSNMLLGDDRRCDPRLISFLAESRHDERHLNPHMSRSTPIDERIAAIGLSELRLSALLERAAKAAPELKEASVTHSTETIAGELPTGKEGDPNKDGTYITLHISRPATGNVTYLSTDMPCVYFIHGGMMGMGSPESGYYGRVRDEIAVRANAAVVGIEYRKSAGKAGAHPFPDGLNDAIKGLMWAKKNLKALGVGPKIVVCADCGGANLALAMAIHLNRKGDGAACADVQERVAGAEEAGIFDFSKKDDDAAAADSKQAAAAVVAAAARDLDTNGDDEDAEVRGAEGVVSEGDTAAAAAAGSAKVQYRALREHVSGIYILSPFIYGCYDNHLKVLLSLVENDQYLYSRAQLVLLSSVYDPTGLHKDDPLAWPYHASPEEDLKGFPPTRVILHELDPLRDEGLTFYRKLLRAGVKGASCNTVHGVCHGGDFLAMAWAYDSVFTAMLDDFVAFARAMPALMEPAAAARKGKGRAAGGKKNGTEAGAGGGGRLPGGRWDW